jgi:hypothetical protein
LLLGSALSAAETPYTWTRDHIHVGLRWQPFGREGNNAYDATRPVTAKDSSYAQFWVSWGATERDEQNTDYANTMSDYLATIATAVDRCVAMGIKVEFVFWHVPAWATIDGRPGGYMAKDGLYAEFATRMATHFKGRVDAYQLAHESNLHGFVKDGDMDYLMGEVFIKGAKAIRAVYGDTPVLISTSGCSPCQQCHTLPPLKGTGGESVNDFYDQLVGNPELMQQVDALNLNVSDQLKGYGMIDGGYVSSSWENYDLARSKLDAAGYTHKAVLAAESWIAWDDASMACDVNGDGVKDERDAYAKTVTLMGRYLERGLNTMNFPWSDNSSGWAMGSPSASTTTAESKSSCPTSSYRQRTAVPTSSRAKLPSMGATTASRSFHATASPWTTTSTLATPITCTTTSGAGMPRLPVAATRSFATR